MPETQNPYSPPAAFLESGNQIGTVVREGKLVRLDRDGRLPERCIACNASGTGVRITRTLYWSKPSWRFAAFAIPVAILALGNVAPAPLIGAVFWGALVLIYLIHVFVRARVKLDCALCAAHHRVNRIMVGISVLCLLAVLGLLGGLLQTANGEVSMALLIAILIMLAVETGRRLFGPLKVSAARVDGRSVWLRGTGRAFYESLPGP